jgi:hypothetical protein
MKPVPFLNLEQQSKYKYIIHVDGNVAAYRLLKMMLLGSLLLRVKSDYYMWMDKGDGKEREKLEEGKHYVGIKSDLSDLKEVVEWCKLHDKECAKIAKEGRAFAKKWLKRKKMEELFCSLLWETC